MYDYLIVGAGLYGSVFAHAATSQGHTCLVVEKRNHIAGNLYTEKISGIYVHKYGPHIFHTNNRKIWDFITSFAEFNHFINSPIAISGGVAYNLPFNMNTFSTLWGVTTPQEARDIIQTQIAREAVSAPRNLEEQALSLVGREIYEKLIKSYTEKQWGRPCNQLPDFIIKRIPLRFTYDNNYFNDRFQGIPIGGYTPIIEKMLSHCDVLLNSDYNALDKARYPARKTIYTGPIDYYFDYCYGHLQYRGLQFETVELPQSDFQGNAVVNYSDPIYPFTRIVEHKHFNFENQPTTVITKEYPVEVSAQQEPFYPLNDEKNTLLYQQYRELAHLQKDVFFGGRLAEYRYYNMDEIIGRALADYENWSCGG